MYLLASPSQVRDAIAAEVSFGDRALPFRNPQSTMSRDRWLASKPDDSSRLPYLTRPNVCDYKAAVSTFFSGFHHDAKKDES